ncbi:MAG: DUF2202 domain-containing protein [Ignavibacteria bacterium]|nr:DUF2202 domain-containing protein [Ignavibacteria bacterium]
MIESAKFEELDIVDIEKLISTVQNEYIKSTFGSLTGISKDHLKAIVRELSERGIEYSPSYLSKDELLIVYILILPKDLHLPTIF